MLSALTKAQLAGTTEGLQPWGRGTVAKGAERPCQARKIRWLAAAHLLPHLCKGGVTKELSAKARRARPDGLCTVCCGKGGGSNKATRMMGSEEQGRTSTAEKHEKKKTRTRSGREHCKVAQEEQKKHKEEKDKDTRWEVLKRHHRYRRSDTKNLAQNF
eukprot:1160705-Pelagomonas_calceolata.AAC.5